MVDLLCKEAASIVNYVPRTLLAHHRFSLGIQLKGLWLVKMRDLSQQLQEVMGAHGRDLSHPGVTIRLINQMYVCVFMLLHTTVNCSLGDCLVIYSDI